MKKKKNPKDPAYPEFCETRILKHFQSNALLQGKGEFCLNPTTSWPQRVGSLSGHLIQTFGILNLH